MLRAMLFIDYQNFIIAVRDMYNAAKKPWPKIDYTALPNRIVERIPNADLIKTTLFIPKPDDFLMTDESLSKEYSWAKNLGNKAFFDVCEGQYISGPISGKTKDIKDPFSYTKREKGTDINMAIEALSKAFFNAYDIAVFLSGDSDYISIYKMLHSMGKLNSVAAVKGQNIKRVLEHVDHHQYLDINFLDTCVMPQEQIKIKTK